MLQSFTVVIGQVLSDDKKRAMYDRYGEDGVKSTVGGQAGGAYAVLLLFTSPSVCVFMVFILRYSLFFVTDESI